MLVSAYQHWNGSSSKSNQTSWTSAVLFGFACAYDGGGGSGNRKNKYVLWILQHSLIFLAMIHFQSQSNLNNSLNFGISRK